MIITKIHTALVRAMVPVLGLTPKAGKGMWSAVQLRAFHSGPEKDWLVTLAATHGVTVEVMQRSINELPAVVEVIMAQVTDEEVLGGWHRADGKWVKFNSNGNKD